MRNYINLPASEVLKKALVDYARANGMTLTGLFMSSVAKQHPDLSKVIDDERR